MDLDGKRVDLVLLLDELALSSVAVNGLGQTGDGSHTYDPDGAPVDIPPEGYPVVEAHVAPPPFVEHVQTVTVDAIVRTTDAAATEVFRLETLPRHLYRGTFSLLAIDAGSGASKDTEARLSFKQQGGAAVQVGATVVISTIQDAQATGWTIAGGADQAAFVVSVRGAAGRTIDWALQGSVAAYSPEGL